MCVRRYKFVSHGKHAMEGAVIAGPTNLPPLVRIPYAKSTLFAIYIVEIETTSVAGL